MPVPAQYDICGTPPSPPDIAYLSWLYGCQLPINDSVFMDLVETDMDRGV